MLIEPDKHTVDHFFKSIRRNNYESVEQLIKVYGLVESLDDNEMTGFLVACSESNASIVQLLVDNGSDIHSNDEVNATGLTLASERGATEIVELLIKKYNSDVHKTGFVGRNCFLAAAEGGQLETLKFLHSVNKTLFQATDDNGDTALTLACTFGEKATVEWLISELRVNFHETGRFGRNCFLSAACGGKIEIMKYLHTVDEDLCQARDDDSNTALIIASRYGSKDSVEVLVNLFKADIYETGFEDQNCFAAAADRGKRDSLKYLINYEKFCNSL